MDLAFITLAALTLLGAVAAMLLPNLVHCALCLTLTFAGLAGLYLKLGAEFVGLAQILVYIGAVAILVLFAILLTRRDNRSEPARFSPSWKAGLPVALVVLGSMALVISTGLIGGQNLAGSGPSSSVQRIGELLMTEYVVPLEVIALALTVAMIGAVVIAMPERNHRS